MNYSFAMTKFIASLANTTIKFKIYFEKERLSIDIRDLITIYLSIYILIKL